jgi:hypothetical protein
MPAYDEDAIVASTEEALASVDQAAPLLAAARATAAAHSLEREHAAFIEILGRLDELWKSSA